MQKQVATSFHPYQFGEAALVASRQVWLAGLGATVVTRDWVQSEAGHVFKTLVKEGTVVESRAIRFFGDQFESSLARANTAWKADASGGRIDGERGRDERRRLRATGAPEVTAENRVADVPRAGRGAGHPGEADEEGREGSPREDREGEAHGAPRDETRVTR